MTINNNTTRTTKLRNDANFASLIAGISSGTIASVICAPLDLVKTRLQVQGAILGHKTLTFTQMLVDVVHHDGIKGIFRGLTPTLACVPIFWGLYFPMYEYAKPMFGSLVISSSNNNILIHNSDNDNGNTYNDNKYSHWVHLASAITSGAVADILVNPMFLVRTRMQTESLHHFVEHKIMPKLTMRQTIKSLLKEGNGNPLIFWRGLSASMLGLSHVGIQFPVYEYLKAEARRRNAAHGNLNSQESALDLLVASGISKLVACATTYPHEVIRSRAMDLRGESGIGMTSTVKLILKEEGWQGFYRGLHVSLIRVLPNCCLTFISYELILRYVKEDII